MSYPVIAVHAVICTPEGEKKQVQVPPGQKFSVSSKEEYEYLKSVGAVKDDETSKKAAAKDDETSKKAATGTADPKKSGKHGASDNVIG